jgi:hypothetical protein
MEFCKSTSKELIRARMSTFQRQIYECIRYNKILRNIYKLHCML